FGCSASIHESNEAKLMLDLGCKKKGTDYLDVFISSLGGFTTRWVVDFNLLLVNLCNISPTFTTMSSPLALIANHSPSLVNTSNPSALAPINKVIRLMSS